MVIIGVSSITLKIVSSLSYSVFNVVMADRDKYQWLRRGSLRVCNEFLLFVLLNIDVALNSVLLSVGCMTPVNNISAPDPECTWSRYIVCRSRERRS